MYPNEVSKQLLDSLRFKSLLDAGCGVGTEFAKYCISYRNACYIGVDNGQVATPQGGRKSAVSLFREGLSPFYTNNSHLLDLDLRTIGDRYLPKIDLVHMRFVLMHLSLFDRRLVLEQLTKLKPQIVVLVERDYSTFDAGTSKPRGILQSFIETGLEFMVKVGADPYAGQAIKELVEGVWPGKAVSQVFQQPAGEYWQDLLDLSLLEWSLAELRGMKDFAEKFKASHQAFLFIRGRNEPLVFVPPALRTAFVRL